ncbi:gamma-butyrobetaine hydroxylase-like domain-containing protein [Methylopila sp. M107]|uniref:gamma-butyrobetaine hydroxylase-like domain-containing protein n=1 Tax=Methylopila sp. M107 TaxID=1101190 RepID=UPI000377358A|nr:gamma-butyrobetaine hydroxylase-like domain-containing protein [Methylopila sp. M107]
MIDAEAHHPAEVRLSGNGRLLELLWGDGSSTRLGATTLRRGSRSAGSVRAAVDGRTVEPPEDLAIRDVEPIGAYALRLAFSDGHDRGVYPWGYLRELGAE